MKLLITVLMFALIGCDNFIHGRQGAVVVKDGKQQIMTTTCNGAAEDWGTCNVKAMKACPNNYIVLDKKEDSHGVFRSLTFQCKK